MRSVIHRYLGIVHRLKKAALCFRGRAVDLVSQHDMREKGTGLKLKILPLRIIDRHPDDIRRQEVTGKLDPFETAPQGMREALCKRSLPDARHILDQQMAAGQLDGMTAFMTGKLKVEGDMSNAMQLQGVLAKLR